MGSDLIRWDGEGSLKTDTELDLRDETGKRRGQADFGNNNGMCKGHWERRECNGLRSGREENVMD